MWYHPDCLGLSEEQAESLTENDSWMCPECEDKKTLTEKKKVEPKIEKKVEEVKPRDTKRIPCYAVNKKPINVVNKPKENPREDEINVTKSSITKKDEAAAIPSAKKTSTSAAVNIPKKNLLLTEKLKKV